MKRNKLTNLLKIGVFLFGISVLLWNCEKDEIIEPSSKLSITKVDATHFLNNYNVQSKIEERNNYNLANRSENSEIEELLNFTVIGDYAKFIEQNNYNSYTFSIIRENPIDGVQENFFLSLQPDGTYKEFLVWYYLDRETFIQAENDMSLLVGQKMKMIDLNLLQQNNNTASRSGFGDLVDALPDGCYEAFPCDCDEGGGYGVREIDAANCPGGDSGQVSGNVGSPGTSSTSGTGSSEGGSSVSGGTGGNGTNEPAQIPDTTSPTSSPFTNFYQGLTYQQQTFLNITPEVNSLINSYLNINNYSSYSQAYSIEAINILSSPFITSNNLPDYRAELNRMANHLKQWGNPEDEFFADYIHSLLNDLNSMTINDVKNIYSLTRTQVHNLTKKYLQAIVIPFAEAAYPFIIYALTEATLGAALPLLSRIPIAMVIRGARLNKMLRQLSKIGTPLNNNEFFRKITGSSVNKAKELFKTTTKDAISVTSPNAQGTIVANMGNNTYITFRTVSDTSGVIATIDINASSLFSQIVKLKFYP